MRRGVSIGLAVLLLLGVGYVIFRDSRPELTTVRGVIGSEKLAFFADQRVADAFASHGPRVEVDPAGSREIATKVDLNRYDFAFRPARRRPHPARPPGGPYLRAVPLAHRGGHFRPHRRAADQSRRGAPGPRLPGARRGRLPGPDPEGHTRWDQLPGNTSYPARKNVLITTTDPEDSNSAAMYLGIVSYVANNQQVDAAEQATGVTVQLTPTPRRHDANHVSGPLPLC